MAKYASKGVADTVGLANQFLGGGLLISNN